jgi:hypothetical protein
VGVWVWVNENSQSGGSGVPTQAGVGLRLRFALLLCRKPPPRFRPKNRRGASTRSADPVVGGLSSSSSWSSSSSSGCGTRRCRRLAADGGSSRARPIGTGLGLDLGPVSSFSPVEPDDDDFLALAGWAFSTLPWLFSSLLLPLASLSRTPRCRGSGREKYQQVIDKENHETKTSVSFLWWSFGVFRKRAKRLVCLE